MSATTARRLVAQAQKLEDQAIETAEGYLDHSDWPRRSHSIIAHAELKLKAAVLLRERAKDHT